jgi:hypothetical protein
LNEQRRGSDRQIGVTNAVIRENLELVDHMRHQVVDVHSHSAIANARNRIDAFVSPLRGKVGLTNTIVDTISLDVLATIV